VSGDEITRNSFAATVSIGAAIAVAPDHFFFGAAFLGADFFGADFAAFLGASFFTAIGVSS
jgi:hypothetical protein